jgi:DNA modification methylase
MIEINKIYCESNLETMARMPDNFIDLTVTSPPYDDLRTYNGYSFPFEEIAKELYRVTKQGGVVVWVVGDATVNGSETGTSFRQALYFKEIGFSLHDTMIYAKHNPIPLTHNRYEQGFEYMFVLSKGKPKTFNPIMENCVLVGSLNNRRAAGIVPEAATRSRQEKTIVKEKKQKINIWSYIVGYNEDSVKHPAVFPQELAQDHILSWSNEGDLVYDCFGGSGTTAKMAHKWKRNWILSEISQEYVELANKRLKPYLSQLTMF